MPLRKVFSVSAMFKTSSSQLYGCDENECTLKSGATVQTKTLAYIMVYFDLMYCLVFVVATLYMKSRFREMIEEVDEGNTTAADYAVSVWGLPKSTSTESLGAHFAKYDGSICPPPQPSGLEAVIGGQNKVAPEAGGNEPSGEAGTPLADIEAPSAVPFQAPLKSELDELGDELEAIVVGGDGGGGDDAAAAAAAAQDGAEGAAAAGEVVCDVGSESQGVVEASGAQFGSGDVLKSSVVDVFLVRRDADILTR